MKNYIVILFFGLMVISCAEKPKEKTALESNIALNKRATQNNSAGILNYDLIADKHVNVNNAIAWLDTLKTRYADILERKQTQLDSLVTITPVGNVLVPDFALEAMKNALSRDIEELNKTYDKKYIQLISDLNKELRVVADSKLLIGEENWYDKIGHVYYHSKVIKYQRK